MYAAIRAIDYHLPTASLSNETLVQTFSGWSAEKIEAKTGIANRRIAAEGELASDLAVKAAEKLFARDTCRRDDIDFLLFCTQSPDYLLPTTACLLQERLGLPRKIGALDFNLGCSGYIYGLSLAKGLIETGECRNLLLLTGETYSKHIAPGDFNVRTIFGDGAAATLIQAVADHPAADQAWIGPFVYGTDGRGEKSLIVRRGSLRAGLETGPADAPASLYMDGPGIFSFTLQVVPSSIRDLLEKAGLTLDDVDLFVFHQANAFMLEHLRKKLSIPPEKFVYALRDFGNTVSATIPIALREAAKEGKLLAGMRVMLVGFGVGYSWGSAMVRWRQPSPLSPN
jgi:3-oxoacyl-[acyl-carrier-protein] synthase-3